MLDVSAQRTEEKNCEGGQSLFRCTAWGTVPAMNRADGWLQSLKSSCKFSPVSKCALLTYIIEGPLSL